MLYRENQVGGNCRIHALNAFFQEPRITPQLFQKYIIEFDSYSRYYYNTIINSADFDLVNSDQNNIVCFILKKEKPDLGTHYFALNYHFLHGQDVRSSINASEFFFVYNSGHIWGVKKYNDKWYTLDSLAAISECDISELLNRSNIGFIVALPARSIFRIEYANIVRNIELAASAKKTHENIVKFIIEKHTKKEILGNIETSINVCVDTMQRLKIDSLSAHKKGILNKIVQKYYTFLPIFTNGEYNNLALKISFLPYIIYGIIYLSKEFS